MPRRSRRGTAARLRPFDPRFVPVVAPHPRWAPLRAGWLRWALLHRVTRGTAMADIPTHTVVAEGLRFPEGPVAMPDGTVLVVEVRGGTLSRVHPDGKIEEVALVNPEGHGGANGAAIGPDGAAYV